MLITLPVLMALSWMPASSAAEKPAAPQQAADAVRAAVGTITCPLTGKEIPSCCCPAER